MNLRLHKVIRKQKDDKIVLILWSEALDCNLREVTTTDLENNTFVGVLSSSRIVAGHIGYTPSFGYYIDDTAAIMARNIEEFETLYMVELYDNQTPTAS
jgi:hypothetical protein